MESRIRPGAVFSLTDGRYGYCYYICDFRVDSAFTFDGSHIATTALLDMVAVLRRHESSCGSKIKEASEC